MIITDNSKMSRRKQAKPNRLQEGEEDDTIRPGDNGNDVQDGEVGRSRLGEDSFDDDEQSVGSGDEGKFCDFLFSPLKLKLFEIN